MEEYLTDNIMRFDPSLGDPKPNWSEEAFVMDDRAGLTPSQMVERKLIALQNASVSFNRLDSSTRGDTVS